MKLHLTTVQAPFHMYSCASRVISMLTGEPDEQITLRVMRRRIEVNKWKPQRAQRETQMMWDSEIRFELRKWLCKTRCIYPQRKTTVLELSHRLKRNEWAIVMVPQHIIIICNGRLYDVNNHGTRISFCNMWRNAKVYWYQRLKL